MERYETARRLQESNDKIEADRKAAEEQKMLAAEANELLAQGRVRDAEECEQRAMMAAMVTLAPAQPQVKGASSGTKYTYEVDMLTAMKEVVEGRKPLMWSVGDTEEPLFLVNDRVVKAMLKRSGKDIDFSGITVSESASIRRKSR